MYFSLSVLEKTSEVPNQYLIELLCVCVCVRACVQEKGEGVGRVSVHFTSEIHIWDIYFFKYRSLALADI